MSKKRRTKKEKMITQIRRESLPQITYTFDSSVIIENKRENASSETKISKGGYSYVLKDVRKTLIVTSLLVVLNLGFYFLLQNKIISVPFIGF